MAIAKRPSSAPKSSDEKEKAVQAFIAGGGAKPEPEGEVKAKAKERKTPTLIRLDDDVLGRLDAVASRLGLSRAAYVRLLVSRALAEEEGRK